MTDQSEAFGKFIKQKQEIRRHRGFDDFTDHEVALMREAWRSAIDHLYSLIHCKPIDALEQDFSQATRVTDDSVIAANSTKTFTNKE